LARTSEDHPRPPDEGRMARRLDLLLPTIVALVLVTASSVLFLLV
jgi:hypothetical protein